MEKFIQITSGRGPLECQWVTAKVLKYFIEELIQENIKYSIIHRVEGDENLTLKSVTLALAGNNLNEFLQNWLGTICWEGKSEFRKFHKRSRWFIGIFELEDVAQFYFNEKDIQFQTIRSQGNGGQNVNKVNTAVRATHIPSGTSVFAQDSRSQLENKKNAVHRLKDKMFQKHLERIENQMQATWNNHLQVERGNPVRIFSGTDFKRNFKEKNFKKTRNQLKNDLTQQQWNL